jgi:polyisoprenoid-binding protein YceI
MANDSSRTTQDKTMNFSALFKLGALSTVMLMTAAHADQKLLPAQSEIGFVSKQMGVPVEGRFKKFDAQIAFDPKKPEASKIAFTIDTGSATLGVPETDAELPKAPWFNVPKFPQATFQSSAVKGLGAGKFEVTGKLSIKGNVRDVVVPVTLTQSGATTTASGAFAVKRLGFKIGEGDWADTSMVADDVQVKFKLALSGVAKF